ncbi:MAG TPA: MBL fold metallo-hydrolase [Gemmatimonadaceae bacterium]|nr:MBL fold metallo-hydrolase [Gemmatimonadaceae bacterium]
MPLSVRLWGTRGSVPSPGAGTVRYGGNTSCVEVRGPEGGTIILDAGTGIRELGDALLARDGGRGVDVDLLLTHLHWDHIQGLPFFAPLYERGTRLRVWAAPADGEAAHERVLRRLMAPTVFPVGFEEAGATVEFPVVPATSWTLRGCEIDHMRVWHPGGALGYHLHAPGVRGFVFIPDNELRAANAAPGGRERIVRFCAGARVLLHDSTYTAEEYERRVGWGHSTVGDALALALEAGVERLILFHHAPERRDDEVDALLDECRAEIARRGNALEIEAAMEGGVIEV